MAVVVKFSIGVGDRVRVLWGRAVGRLGEVVELSYDRRGLHARVRLDIPLGGDIREWWVHRDYIDVLGKFSSNPNALFARRKFERGDDT